MDVVDAGKVDLLRRATGLDLGESEAIVYADDVSADLLLMDEAAGRKVAENMGLPITGSIGILIRAARLGYTSVSEAESMLDRIRNSNRRISEALLQQAQQALHSEA